MMRQAHKLLRRWRCGHVVGDVLVRDAEVSLRRRRFHGSVAGLGARVQPRKHATIGRVVGQGDDASFHLHLASAGEGHGWQRRRSARLTSAGTSGLSAARGAARATATTAAREQIVARETVEVKKSIRIRVVLQTEVEAPDDNRSRHVKPSRLYPRDRPINGIASFRRDF